MEHNNDPPTPPSTVLGGGSLNALQIPEAKDGFFGYTEEKSLQHVRILPLFSFLVFT
jgi:AMP deaminase